MKQWLSSLPIYLILQREGAKNAPSWLFGDNVFRNKLFTSNQIYSQINFENLQLLKHKKKFLNFEV